MKKALGILSVLVLITVMMISCNAEQKLDDTVGVSFNVSSSRELSVANESFVAVDSPDLTWYYHGEKKTDPEFITGQSGTGDDYWTYISTGNELSATSKEFSQGQWSFEIKAVSTEKGTQVYYGRTNANVLLTKENRTISISVSPFVEGVNGTLVLSNVYIAPLNSDEKVVPNELYINGEPIDITEDIIVYVDGGKAISYTGEVAPGTYTVEVKRVGEDTGVVLASASKTVVVYSGLTTTISGSVEEDTTSGRFDVNSNEFVINTKEDLILFRDLVNEVGINFSGKTVKLAANIDLAGVEWKPIGQTGKTTFQGVFDGQGYTISNMTVNNTDTSENCSSGFFGWIEDHGVGIMIKNTKFDNAYVEGNHNVGVVVGYIYGTIDGCEVSNSTIIAHNANDDANGDKVGGIAGFVGEDAFIDNNKVVNCEINGNRDIGGIAGAVNSGVDSFKENQVSDTQITYITEKSYASAAEIVSGRTGFVPDETNTATNVTVNINKLVTSSDEFKTVLDEVNDGDTITLSNDIALTEPLTIKNSVTLEGNGSYTISGYPISVSTDANVTFNKVNFATPDNNSHNASSVYASGLTGKVVFEECTFTNPQWECIQITPMDGAEIVVKNCSFIVDGSGTYAQANGTKVERLLHIQNTAASGNYTATITNNSFIGVDLCRNAVIDVDDIAEFANVTCGGNTFANHDGTPVSTLSDGMIYININGKYDAEYVATNTYAQFTQTPAARLQH